MPPEAPNATPGDHDVTYPWRGPPVGVLTLIREFKLTAPQVDRLQFLRWRKRWGELDGDMARACDDPQTGG